MRTVIELRRPPGSVPIEDIKPDAKSRDDIPALPVGLQAVYRDELRQKNRMGFWTAFVPGGMPPGTNSQPP